MKDKCLVITTGCCILVCLVIAVLGLTLMDSLIISFVSDNAAMMPETQTLWGQVPGDTGTQVIRKFTFFDFQNPMGYLFRNQSPIFVQRRDFIIQQLSSMLDLQYNDDSSEVEFNYWLHFETRNESRNMNDKINMIHAAPLGFWSQLDTMNSSTFSIQGLGPLFIELNRTFKSIAIGQGVAQLFLNNSLTIFMRHCLKYQFSQLQCNFLWQDPINGLSNQNNYQIWIQASLMNSKQSRKYIIDYYSFCPQCFFQLFDQFKQWASALNQIINNQYCENRQCTSGELAIKQLSSSQITNNPPAGMKASISFCDQNDTCKGFYPQLSAFTSTIMYPPFNQTKYSQELVKNLFTPGKGLLHIGNLQKLWQWGNLYDLQFHPKYEPTPSKYLQKIKNKFNMQSQQQTFVFWQWLKYFTNEFVLKRKQGGSGKVAGFGGLVAGSLYQSFTDFGDWILPELRSFLARQQVRDCQQYIYKLFLNTTANITRLQSVCQNVDFSNYRTYYNILKPCLDYQLDQNYFDDDVSLFFYCDKTQPSIFKLIQKIQNQITNKYGCNGKCSSYELSLKQIINSTVTMNPIKQSYAKKSFTARNINPNFKAFQYSYFIQEIRRIQRIDVTLNEEQLYKLFSFDKLFSAPMCSNLLLTSSQDEFQKDFYWHDYLLFKDYLRYILLQVGFQGFTIQRSANDYIYGYDDPFLVKLSSLSPLQGGDPSVPTWVAFNEPNMKKNQAYTNPMKMNTGKIDVDMVRQYVEVLRQNYITYNRSWFDGDRVGWSIQNPWKQKVNFNGTDSIQNKPNFQKTDKVSVYLTTIWRGGQLEYNKTVEMFGLQLYEMKIDQYMLASQYQYEYNSIFYQDFNGFLNLSFQGLPLFVSKNHFYSAPTNWSYLVEFYDEDGNKQDPNPYDDTSLLIQPYSGASFIACIYLQTNYYNTPDLLFQRDRRMLPMFSLYRSGNISQSAVDEYFTPLKIALSLKRVLFLVGLIISFSMVLILVGCKMHKKNKERQQKKDSLLQSVEG